MEEKKLKNRKFAKEIITCLISLLSVCLAVLFFARILTNISVGAESYSTDIEVNLEKYVNFKISDQDKGTLTQYNVKSTINQEEGKEYLPIKESELTISLNQINGKYPYAVKVITASTELTNGKTEDIQEDYQYTESTGTVVIKTSNENENGEPINSAAPSLDAKDEHIIICYYDTYVEQSEEREIGLKVGLKSVLFEDDIVIDYQDEFKETVKDNISELTSVSHTTDGVYNGYIKSNVINGTNYNTQYKEKQSIIVSKKEAQEKLEVLEENTFVKIEKNQNDEEITTDLGNNGKLIYKSTKIKKSDIINLLGEDGIVEILDKDENVLATIDKNTKFEEDGTIVINYEDELEAIIVKTSAVKNEGILNLENTKEIKSTMLSVINTKIKTTGKIVGTKEKVEIVNNEEVKTDVETFTNDYENMVDIKETSTNVEMEINSLKWTNKQQNEVVFDIYVDSNTAKNNMLKNPKIKIELPSQVEKVVLGNSSVVYANGLELQTPTLDKSSNGNIVIVANLTGTQTEYDENTLGLITDVKIAATVILKKDIENSLENVNLTYSNNYTLDGSTETITKSKELQIESYKDESVTVEESSATTDSFSTFTTSVNSTQVEGLTMEVEPVRGDTVLKDGDTIYEGEFIKYNIKVTNTSDKRIDNIKVVGNIPEGTTYGELEADYYTALGKYEYNYDETIKEKTIEIGSLEVGESSNKFYEVKVDNLEEGQFEKQIVSNIKTYVGGAQVLNYEITNIIEPADVQVFLTANLDHARDRWNYHVKVSSKIEKEVTVKLKVPKEFELGFIVHEGKKIYVDDTIQISEDNIIITTIQLNALENNEWIFEGTINSSKVEKETNNSKIELYANATIIDNDIIYKSNENRILFEYDSVSIVMSSENEGEEVKYGDEINYEMKITNVGRTNLNDPAYNSISIRLVDLLPEDIKPISVIYEDWKDQGENADEKFESYIPTGIYNKIIKTKDISGICIDKDGNKLPNVDLNLVIPYGESVTIKVKAMAGSVSQRTKIENSATITGYSIDSKTSNTIAHIILPYNDEEIENTEEQDKPINPDIPSDSNEKYSINGVAWVDENEDGKRQTNEKLLDGITVMLVDMNNSSEIKAKQTTDSKGAYCFSEIDKGKYIVAFNYDTETYSVTEYQKNGVSNDINSDVTDKEITLSGNKKKVGLTDILSIDATMNNVDIGLIKNKICDLKLDKYISKVIVNTENETTEQEYDNTKLAKVEIKAKEIEGAIVVVEYKIIITNEGELPTTVNKVVDYLPEGLEFSSELNTSWIKTNKGEIINTNISNKKIDPGKSIELTLIATKTMTENDTGTFTNIAEIEEMSNSLSIMDIDSNPGNKVEEDDYSKAELIISINTGNMVVYISFFIIILAIIGVCIKFGIPRISKIFLFGIILFTTVFSCSTAIGQEYTMAPQTAYFYWSGYDDYGNIINKKATEFYSPTVGNASCVEEGADVPGWKHEDEYYYEFVELKDSKPFTKENIECPPLTLVKQNNDEDVKITKLGSNYILGPFKIKRNDQNSYSYEIITNKGTTKKGSICDVNGDSTSLSGNSVEFYLKISTSNISADEQIKKIKVTANVTGTRTIEYYQKGKAKYKCNFGEYQEIETEKVFVKKYKEDDTVSYSPEPKSVEWEIKYGSLKIIKTDEDSGKALNGIGFKIYSDSEGKWLDSTGQATKTSFSSAYEFKTANIDLDGNGKIGEGESGVIKIDKLPIGKRYYIYETNLGEYSDIYEIGNTKIDGEIEQAKLVWAPQITSDVQVQNITNKQKYVTLSGFVWLDNYERNDIYDDEFESLINNVQVKLKDKNTGNEVKSTTTSITEDGIGQYKFEKVNVNKLEDYYIEFTYDGLTYQNVNVNKNNKNGSKASEGTTGRENFNNMFESIENDTSINKTKLTYDFSNHKSVNTNKSVMNKVSIFVNHLKVEKQGDFTIISTTENAGYNINDSYTQGTREISGINLGLYEREQPDLSLTNDIDSIKVSVNGYNHTYKYNGREDASWDGDGFDNNVKFGKIYGAIPYNLPMYEAEVKDNNSELKVDIIYKVKIRNEANNLVSKINSLVDYYNPNLDLEKVGTKLLNGDISEEGKLDFEVQKYNNNYNKAVINKISIEPNSDKYIYMKFSVNRDNMYNIMFDQDGNKKDIELNNVIEINSYTTYYKNKLYAGIDKDSRPGSTTPDDKYTYEDDTDSIKLKMESKIRTISGTVFLDKTYEDLKTGEERLGDGIYDKDKDSIIPGIKVSMKDKDGNIIQIYNKDTNEFENAELNTGEDGNYNFSGFIPGEYNIVYTWGDETYTVNDYKCTIFRDEERYNNSVANNKWYKDNVNTRFSDALDDYGVRQDIDSGESSATTMESTTCTMGFGIEYEDTETDMLSTNVNGLKFDVNNIDFGLAERPRQKLDISKRVSSVKITLANGQTIVDANVEDNKLVGDSTQYVKYTAPDPEKDPWNGLLSVEIDNELIQGSTLQIGYEIEVNNNSELDYKTEDYYKYGTNKENVVTITPQNVYDYLDEIMPLNETENTWKYITGSITEEEKTIVNNYYKEVTETPKDGTVIFKSNWEKSNSEYFNIFEEWREKKIASIKGLEEYKNEAKKRLQTADLEKEMNPGEIRNVSLYTSKVLANTDEITINNDTEIRKVEQNYGRKITPSTSKLYARGETIIIIPPTGENRAYIIPIAVGLISLVILLGGIILIKKKVL